MGLKPDRVEWGVATSTEACLSSRLAIRPVQGRRSSRGN
jgi:hypothetical protein